MAYSRFSTFLIIRLVTNHWSVLQDSRRTDHRYVQAKAPDNQSISIGQFAAIVILISKQANVKNFFLSSACSNQMSLSPEDLSFLERL